MKSILSASLLCLLALFSYAQKKGNPVPEMKAISGEWEVWISGAVTYVARDARIYLDYQPGAPMNRLTIRENGDYIWGDHKGILKRVTPWYGETGRAYYRISDKKNNTYDFWYNKEEDKLIVLFGEVGGHAATGTRWGTSEKRRPFSRE